MSNDAACTKARTAKAVRAAQTKLHREWAKRNIAKGLCACGKDREEGRMSCASCLAYDRAQKAKRRARVIPAKKALGMCNEVHCMAERVPGMKACDYHLEQKAASETARRHARKAAGKCYRCGADPAPGFMACERHLAKGRASTAKYQKRINYRKRTAA